MSSVESKYIEDLLEHDVDLFMDYLKTNYVISTNRLDKGFKNNCKQLIADIGIDNILSSAKNNQNVINRFIEEKNTYNNELFTSFSVLKLAYKLHK